VEPYGHFKQKYEHRIASVSFKRWQGLPSAMKWYLQQRLKKAQDAITANASISDIMRSLQSLSASHDTDSGQQVCQIIRSKKGFDRKLIKL